MEPNDSKMSVWVNIEEPDIFLVEDLSDINTDALMFNTTIQFKLWMTENSMSMMASLANIQCHTCKFDPSLRDPSMSSILNPCTLSFTYSDNPDHGVRYSYKLNVKMVFFLIHTF